MAPKRSTDEDVKEPKRLRVSMEVINDETVDNKEEEESGD